MKEFHRYNFEWKKLDIQEYILWGPIYESFKTRQWLYGVRSQVNGDLWGREGGQGDIWSPDIVLFLDLVMVTQMCSLCDNLFGLQGGQSLHFSVCVLYVNKNFKKSSNGQKDYGGRDGCESTNQWFIKIIIIPGLQGKRHISRASCSRLQFWISLMWEDKVEAIKLRRRVEPRGCC